MGLRHAPLTAVLALAFIVVTHSKYVELKINLGGEAVDGFSAEEEILALDNSETMAKMRYHGEVEKGSDFPNVFKTQRFSRHEDLILNIPVPDGMYAVSLLFAETWKGAFLPNKRVFDVYLGSKPNGIVKVLDQFDVFKVGGPKTGVVKKFTGIATHGGLTVALRPILQNPQIAGIIIAGHSYQDSYMDELPTVPAGNEPMEDFSILHNIGPRVEDPESLYDASLNNKFKDKQSGSFMSYPQQTSASMAAARPQNPGMFNSAVGQTATANVGGLFGNGPVSTPPPLTSSQAFGASYSTGAPVVMGATSTAATMAMPQMSGSGHVSSGFYGGVPGAGLTGMPTIPASPPQTMAPTNGGAYVNQYAGYGAQGQMADGSSSGMGQYGGGSSMGSGSGGYGMQASNSQSQYGAHGGSGPRVYRRRLASYFQDMFDDESSQSEMGRRGMSQSSRQMQMPIAVRTGMGDGVPMDTKSAGAGTGEVGSQHLSAGWDHGPAMRSMSRMARTDAMQPSAGRVENRVQGYEQIDRPSWRSRMLRLKAENGLPSVRWRQEVSEEPKSAGIHIGDGRLDGVCLENRTHCSCGLATRPEGSEATEDCLYVVDERTRPLTCVRRACTGHWMCACAAGANRLCQRTVVSSLLVQTTGSTSDGETVGCRRDEVRDGTQVMLTPIL